MPNSKMRTLVIGGGMITHDQILPALLQMQRRGELGEIWVCSQHGRTVKALREAPSIRAAFPNQHFEIFPDPDQDAQVAQPDLYKKLLTKLPKGSLVVVALPDQLHFAAVMDSLHAGHHVCCVKPLVLQTAQSLEIEKLAREKGLMVVVEYHKRFDDRAFKAKGFYRQGRLGEFRLGTARLMEKWYYRNSNFQNWFGMEETDCFTYIGCHYVDLVHYITGLLPVSVSNAGVADTFPNGKKGWLWNDTRVRWNNDAILNLQTSLSYPNEGAGPNTQGITLYCGGAEGTGAMLDHSDQYRGLAYSFVNKSDAPGATFYAEPSPDYFQYNDVGGPGLEPVGYGVRSVEAIARTAIRLQAIPELEDRQAELQRVDATGVLATPANSRYNELVVEAGRLSLLNNAREVKIDYANNTVSLV